MPLATRCPARPGTASCTVPRRAARRFSPPMTTSIPPGGPSARRLRGGPLLAIVVVLLVLLVTWWWSLTGEGRQRFRSTEPTPADASAPPG